MSWIRKNKRIVILGILLMGTLLIYFVNNALFRSGDTRDVPIDETELSRSEDMTPDSTEDLSRDAGQDQVVKVKVLKAYKMDFKDSISMIGTARGHSEIGLKFRVTGIIEKIYFHEGQSVKKGDIIASLNKKEANLKYQYNDLEYQKNLKLFEAGAINRSALRKSELELESAKVELEKTDIIAASNGVVARMTVDEGNLAEDEIGVLLNTDFMWVDLSIIEQDIKRVQLGQRIELTFDAFPGKPFESIVNRISPIVEGTSRTITMRTRVENPDRILVAGMFARAKVFIHEKDDAIVVPGSSLKDLDEDGNFDSVYIVDENNVIRAREVKISYISPPPASTYAEIESGLEPGDLVVVYEPSPDDVKDGAPAKIIEPILEDVDLMKAASKSY